ncbi:MAG TPA: serine/threonine-protein kinase [Gemmatales bacterium]|nr:serine/threonine-protein kinase [Gemmatales bacterium]
MANERTVSFQEVCTPLNEQGSALGKIQYFGDYELLEEIARGGMGVVFKSRQISLNRLLALKMILSGQLASPDAIHRFRQEAQEAANLDHPNILPIHEVGEYQGQQYFTMKLVSGGSLAQQVEKYRGNPRPIARLIEIIARAVHYAHRRGILHRDLKPSNILLDTDGQAFVSDFGLAKRFDSKDTPGQYPTVSGAILGTPNYMAPEQAKAEKSLTVAVDVYGLGAILYELLTGQPPFCASNPLDTIRKVIEDELPHPSTFDKTIDKDLIVIAVKCLTKDPKKRYISAEELADELDRWSKGEPIHARPAGLAERIVKWGKRRPAVAALVGGITLAVLSLVIGLWVYNYQVEVNRRVSQATMLVNYLATTDTMNVPRIIEDIIPVKDLAEPLLLKIESENSLGTRPNLHARLALLRIDQTKTKQLLDDLTETILISSPENVRVLRSFLFPHRQQVTATLWKVIGDLRTKPRRVLAAAGALALLDPDSAQWKEVSERVVSGLVASGPLWAASWAEILWPVRLQLSGPLLILMVELRKREDALRRLYENADFKKKSSDIESLLNQLIQNEIDKSIITSIQQKYQQDTSSQNIPPR